MSFLNGTSTFVDYLMLRPVLQKNRGDSIKLLVWVLREFNTFLEGFSPNVNITARLEFELANFEAANSYFRDFLVLDVILIHRTYT